MTNNTFQLNRFSQLMGRSLKSNPKSALLNIAIYAGLPLLFLILNAINIGISIGVKDREVLLNLFMRFVLIFSPFLLYYNYNHPKKGLTEVMLPASATEKYVAIQLTCLVAPLAMLLLFGATDSLLAFIFPKVYGGYAVTSTVKDFFSLGTLTQDFVLMQIILFCNLLFTRRKILKTIGVFILTLIAFLAIAGIGITIWNSMTPISNFEDNSFNFGSRSLFDIRANDHPFVVTVQILRIFLQIVLPILLMIGSYWVLKNKKY